MFERIIFKHVYNHFRDNALINKWQSGFLPGSSTVTQLLEMYNQFYSAIDEGKDVRIVYLDISKAFDRVWHKGLLLKLHKFGIGGNFLKWFSDYLSNRFQRVVINGQCSDWVKVTTGVPQGSVLGPLLFLVFINDITSVVNHCDIRLFADDTCLFVKTSNPEIATNFLNNDLANIENWANQWLIKFSPSLKQNTQTRHKRLIFYNTPIANVSSHKHVGLWITHNLKWDHHSNSFVKKCSTLLGLLKLLKFKLNRAVIEKIFLSYIRPIMEYGDIVWSGAPTSLLVKLDHLVVEAMRLITGAPARSNIASLYREMGWQLLSTRREIHILRMMYKISTGLAPSYLADILATKITQMPPNLERLRPGINSRLSVGDYPIPTVRTKLREHSFSVVGSKLWNSLPSELKSKQSLGSFSRALQKVYSNNLLKKETKRLQFWHLFC